MSKEETVEDAYNKKYSKDKNSKGVKEIDDIVKKHLGKKKKKAIKLKAKTKSGKKTMYSKMLEAKEKRDKAISKAI